MKQIFLGLTICLMATSVGATDWVIGAGSSRFNRDNANDSNVLTLEIHSNPFLECSRFSMGYIGVLSVHNTGDAFVGIGLSGLYELNNNWFIEGSIAPGYFEESSQNNDLGSAFEIRSLLGVGYDLGAGNSVSIGVTHKSNASTSNINPGVDALLLRYRQQF